MYQDESHATPASHTASSRGRDWITRAVDFDGFHSRMGYWLVTLPEVLGWYQHVVYTGHSLKKREEGWLLIVHATKKGRKVVQFTNGRTPSEAIHNFAMAVNHDAIVWRDDLY